MKVPPSGMTRQQTTSLSLKQAQDPPAGQGVLSFGVCSPKRPLILTTTEDKARFFFISTQNLLLQSGITLNVIEDVWNCLVLK
jgi:hypothetical protein